MNDYQIKSNNLLLRQKICYIAAKHCKYYAINILALNPPFVPPPNLLT